MAAQKGKDLLLKMLDPISQLPTTVAGMHSRRIAFNAESVDVTDFESAGRWRELLAGAGVQRAAISGSGIFKDAASDAKIRTQFFAGEVTRFQAVLPDFGTLEGNFQIVSLEYGAEHNGEATFDMSLESAGPISFVAAT